jgi:hypothetical protein
MLSKRQIQNPGRKAHDIDATPNSILRNDLSRNRTGWHVIRFLAGLIGVFSANLAADSKNAVMADIE